ncbi:SusD/RagB family nutrient-binding outer membrane lipoprotein [Niabella pedocola]|uniref:SusD/RagB family nutrient-binding outer membrane lipoprotein n=1 Tax=Niabella pedocola TaxID=1752077 RepID=A0ABS8PXC5_9BACT|nr:SusD/RagB family nutrient-binding outer membrane lipoprotein [Niabella pedocola]MCD2425730.1 SusD/RagB family nutrient-binding outer membrane lipoprotein [Niabella pedocola]
MNIKNYILTLATVGLLTTGCKKGFFDINVSPNNPAEATPALVLPSAVAGSAFVFGGYYQAVGAYWTQQYAQSAGASQWADWESYNLTDNDFDRQFTTLYAGALYDYKYVKDKASAASSWKFYAIAGLMQAYTFQVLADLYDKIPFTEALNGTGTLQPKYDDGQAVYDGLLAMIDDALSKDLSSASVPNPGTTDVIFGGDMGKWRQFANTLKLKIYLRYVNVDANKYSTQIKALLAENNFLTSDAAFTSFKAEQTGANPFYNTFVDRLAGNVIANTTLMSWLTEHSDPRRNGIYKASETGSTWASLNSGQYLTATGTIKSFATPNIGSTYPVYFFTKEEVLFLIAEAEARYGSAANAKTAFDAGVKASFDSYSLGGSAIVYPYNGVPSIIEQKWVASTNKRSLEAFFDYNRTGYPAGIFTRPPTSIWSGNDRPKRFFFAASERKSNSNTPQRVDLNVPVWWAKQ